MTQQNIPSKPRTFDEIIAEHELTPEEAQELEAKTYEEASKVDPEQEEIKTKAKVAAGLPAPADRDAPIPDWVQIPPELKIPPNRQVYFILFRAKLTNKPEKGDRQAILWSLSDADEKFVYKRLRNDSARTLAEMTRQMIRAIDGHKVTWGGVAEKNMVLPDPFWDEIGGKYRKELQSIYLKTHSLDDKETADFFANCVFVATSSRA